MATLENDSGWHHIYRGCKYAEKNVFLAQNKPLSRNCSNAMCLLILFVKKFTSVWQNASLFCQGNSVWHCFVRESTLTSFCQGIESEFILSGNLYYCSLLKPVFKYNLNSQICVDHWRHVCSCKWHTHEWKQTKSSLKIGDKIYLTK